MGANRPSVAPSAVAHEVTGRECLQPFPSSGHCPQCGTSHLASAPVEAGVAGADGVVRHRASSWAHPHPHLTSTAPQMRFTDTILRLGYHVGWTNATVGSVAGAEGVPVGKAGGERVAGAGGAGVRSGTHSPISLEPCNRRPSMPFHNSRRVSWRTSGTGAADAGTHRVHTGHWRVPAAPFKSFNRVNII